MADYLPPVVAKLTGDDSSLARTLTSAKASIRRFAAEAGRTRATINVDVKLRDGALAEIRRRINDGPAARLKVELQVGAAQREELRRSLETRPIQATVRPVMDQAALRRVKAALRELGRRIDVPVRPQLDDGSVRRARTQLNRLSQNRTVTIRTRVVGPSGGGGGAGERDAVDGMRALISLAPALVPVAAEAAAVAAQIAGATLAVGAFGLAVIPQIKQLGAAADAQKKYTAAVSKYGPGSTQAAAAQNAFAQSLAGMPAATRQAAGALMVLKDDFKSWSDGLSKFTMEPVARSMAVVQAILPKLSPMVRETSTQFGRLVTVAGGAVASPGFNAFAKRVSDFADRSLKGATDEAIHLMRVLSSGNSSGPLAKFMDYVHTNGPLVKDTLRSVAEAVAKIMAAAAQAGPGMLTLVNAVAKLVASLPTSFVTRALQLYSAFKLFSLVSGGISTAAGGVQSLVTRLVALRAASAAAGGGMAGLRAAFMSLGTAARASVIIAGVAALVLVVAKLSSMGQTAVPSVDRLTTSLANLGRTGKVSGEAAKAYGTDLKGLGDSLRMVARPDLDQQIRGTILSIAGIDTSQMKHAKGNIDAVDKSLADLVKGGHADLAKAALADMTKAMEKQGLTGTELRGKLDDYKSALADQALEQKLAAQSMGLFGDQAIAVQKKLDAQKQAVQGLQQAILDLNDANRAAMDAQSAYQQAIDDATKAITGHRNALAMSNGQLDLGSQKAREAYGALSQLASTAEAAATATLQQTGSQAKANQILVDAHAQLVRVGEQMGLSAGQARRLADSLDNINDPRIRVTLYTQQAMSDLAAAKRRVDAFPKSTRTKANFAYQQALSDLAFWQRQVDRLHGKTVTVRINGVMTGVNASQYYSQGPHKATGGWISGPGTTTSDDVPIMASNKEFVVNAASAQRHAALLEAINSDRVARFASGGKVTAAEKSARSQLAGGFGISGFGRMAGYQRTPFEHELAASTDINALVSSLNGLHGEIKAAFRGRTESSLLTQLAKAGKNLISYDKQLTKVTASLASAKTRLDDLKNSAAQLKSSVAASIMQGASVVTQAPQEGFALSSNDVVNNMNAQLQKAAAFSAQLQQLKKRGLSADLLEQIASAGVDQGGATAAALAGASNSQIKQLNSMQTQLKASANAAGSAIADSMYGAGIRAAEGLVKGLEKKQKAIEAAMLRIAKSMEKAIKHALGIRSPSTVMAQVGDFTALGMAAGITRSSKHAVIAARGMAMSVRHGAALTGTPAWAGMPLATADGGAQVVHNHFTFNVEGSVATVDKLAKDVEVAFLRRGMRNPFTYPAYKR